LQSDQNNFCDAVGLTTQLHNELNIHDIPNTTAVSDLCEKAKLFSIFSPLNIGEWMMGKFEIFILQSSVMKFDRFCFILDTLAQLYAFIRCLKAGIHQSILPNRRITKVQQLWTFFIV
jgi:hypothetical protein